MGFMIHPVFTSIEQEQLFLQQFGRPHDETGKDGVK